MPCIQKKKVCRVLFRRDFSLNYARKVCVFKINPHIHKLLTVFLHGFSCTGRAAVPVIGLRYKPLAVCAIGFVKNMCPYSLIIFLVLQDVCFSNNAAKIMEK